MSLSRQVTLTTEKQGHLAFVLAWKFVKPYLKDNKAYVLEVRPEKRQDRHSRHFHSLINQISKHVGGDLENTDDAKRILISAFRMDTLNDVAFRDEWARFGDLRMGRGLRGEVVMLGTQSKEFTNRLALGFIQWLYAFGAEHDVAFKVWGG